MILIRPSSWTTATPPTALLTADMAIWLQDPMTIAGFQRIGVPLVLMPQAEVLSLTTLLNPSVEHTHAAYAADPTEPNFLPLSHELVDGGAPNTVLYGDDFDGGQSDTTDFTDFAINGGVGYT